MDKVNENLQELFSKMENFISTKTVVGDALHFGDTIIVPLVEVTFGAGSGLSDGNSEKGKVSGGGGLGARLSPVAVIVVVNGTAQLIDVKNKDSVNKIIDLIPGLFSKFNLDGLFKKVKKEGEKPIEEILEEAVGKAEKLEESTT
ncbi:MAG: sporulation protein [Turicibacter sp.]|nr:sporulation protein [Turicibacter sp.]